MLPRRELSCGRSGNLKHRFLFNRSLRRSELRLRLRVASTRVAPHARREDAADVESHQDRGGEELGCGVKDVEPGFGEARILRPGRGRFEQRRVLAEHRDAVNPDDRLIGKAMCQPASQRAEKDTERRTRSVATRTIQTTEFRGTRGTLM